MRCLLQRHFTATGAYVWTFRAGCSQAVSGFGPRIFAHGSGNALTCPFQLQRIPHSDSLRSVRSKSVVNHDFGRSSTRTLCLPMDSRRAWLALVCVQVGRNWNSSNCSSAWQRPGLLRLPKKSAPTSSRLRRRPDVTAACRAADWANSSDSQSRLAHRPSDCPLAYCGDPRRFSPLSGDMWEMERRRCLNGPMYRSLAVTSRQKVGDSLYATSDEVVDDSCQRVPRTSRSTSRVGCVFAHNPPPPPSLN